MTNPVDPSVSSVVAPDPVAPAPQAGAEDQKVAMRFLAEAIQQGRFDNIKIDGPGLVGFPTPPVIGHPNMPNLVERLLAALAANDVINHGKDIDGNKDGVVTLKEYNTWAGNDKGGSQIMTAAFADVVQRNAGQDGEGQLGVKLEGAEEALNPPPLIWKNPIGHYPAEVAERRLMLERSAAPGAPAPDASAPAPDAAAPAPDAAAPEPDAAAPAPDAAAPAPDKVNETLPDPIQAADYSELISKLLEALKGRDINPDSLVGHLLGQLLRSLIESAAHGQSEKLDANKDGVLTLDEFAKGFGADKGLPDMVVAAFADAVDDNPGTDSQGQLGLSLERKLIPLDFRAAEEGAVDPEDFAPASTLPGYVRLPEDSAEEVTEDGGQEETEGADEAEGSEGPADNLVDLNPDIINQFFPDYGDLLPKLLEALMDQDISPNTQVGQLIQALIARLTESDLQKHGAEMDANKDGVVTLPEFMKGKGEVFDWVAQAFADAVQMSAGSDSEGQLGYLVNGDKAIIQMADIYDR